MALPKDEGATPPSTEPYQAYTCPTGCGFTERSGKAPFYSSCPSCHKPAGRFVLAPETAPAPTREELLEQQLNETRSQLEASRNREQMLAAQLRETQEDLQDAADREAQLRQQLEAEQAEPAPAEE